MKRPVAQEKKQFRVILLGGGMLLIVLIVGAVIATMIFGDLGGWLKATPTIGNSFLSCMSLVHDRAFCEAMFGAPIKGLQGARPTSRPPQFLKPVPTRPVPSPRGAHITPYSTYTIPSPNSPYPI